MLFKKYRIRNITLNTYICSGTFTETDNVSRACVYNKRTALSIVNKLQSNLEFVKYSLEVI